jgi:hypothetical protein
MHENDKAILVDALEKAAVDYRKLSPTPSIIGVEPSPEKRTHKRAGIFSKTS